MKLAKETLGPALKLWRERKGLTAHQVVARSKNHDISTKRFDVNTLHRWEAGKRYPKFDHLIDDILPAYGITSLDQFLLLYCSNREPDVSTIRPILKRDLTSNRELGVEIHSAPQSQLGDGNPVRIDMMSVEANRSSTTAAHEGYNYLLVTKGKVKCHFSDGREEKSLDLGAGDAVAFSTRLHHKVEAVDGEVDIVVARSAWGGKPHRAED